jgi:hypothetical protein
MGMDSSLTKQADFDAKANQNFKAKFGYDIPESYDLTPARKKQLKEKREKTCIPQTIESKETVDTLHEEKKRLRKKVTVIQSKIEFMVAENENLKKQIARQQTLQPIPPHSTQKKITPQKLTPQKKQFPQRKTVAFQQSLLPGHNPDKNVPHQKLLILRYLLKEYHVTTTAQLTKKLCEQCKNNNLEGICGRYDRYRTWDYNFLKKELTFDTNDSTSCCCSYDCKHPTVSIF